ncbi:MAG TPA: methylmalonyl Co-A mutase-associated GTPase MeaB [Thermomicrobiales bacterium]|jgi:LAO/AO transport system kinase
MGLADGVLAGSQRALARLATHVENDDDVGRAGLLKLFPHTGRAHVVGVTGPPGAGKSTLISALIGTLLERRFTVGVVAIDPTSPFSGGATLGDRIRMLERQSFPGVFIRSMASRGRTGGLAPATAGMIHLLDAGGYDVILVETVGVGQEQVDIGCLVDTLVLIQVPGSGDAVQLLKAGVLEFADVIVVNKADLVGAEDLARGLRSMVTASPRDRGDWSPPVLRCSATKGEGIPQLADAVIDHFAFLKTDDRLQRRRRAAAKSEIVDRVNAVIARRFSSADARDDLTDRLVDDVAQRRMTSFAAARILLDRWRSSEPNTGESS